MSSAVTTSKVASQFSGKCTTPFSNGKSNISSTPSLFTAKDSFIPAGLLMSYWLKKLSSTSAKELLSCWVAESGTSQGWFLTENPHMHLHTALQEALPAGHSRPEWPMNSLGVFPIGSLQKLKGWNKTGWFDPYGKVAAKAWSGSTCMCVCVFRCAVYCMPASVVEMYLYSLCASNICGCTYLYVYMYICIHVYIIYVYIHLSFIYLFVYF